MAAKAGRGRERGGGGWANPFAIGLVVGLGFELADLFTTIRQAAALPDPAAALKPVGLRWNVWRHIAWRTLKAFGDDRIPTAAAALQNDQRRTRELRAVRMATDELFAVG